VRICYSCEYVYIYILVRYLASVTPDTGGTSVILWIYIYIYIYIFFIFFFRKATEANVVKRIDMAAGNMKELEEYQICQMNYQLEQKSVTSDIALLSLEAQFGDIDDIKEQLAVIKLGSKKTRFLSKVLEIRELIELLVKILDLDMIYNMNNKTLKHTIQMKQKLIILNGS
jgi:hypothetical protein